VVHGQVAVQYSRLIIVCIWMIDWLDFFRAAADDDDDDDDEDDGGDISLQLSTYQTLFVF
jgi:hypothetical protein